MKPASPPTAPASGAPAGHGDGAAAPATAAMPTGAAPSAAAPVRHPAGATAAPAVLPPPWHALALAALLALIALGLAWELWLAPTGSGTLALKVLPLVLALPGLWRGRVRTAQTLSLLVWLYFIEGVVRAWSDRGLSQSLAMVSLALVLLLFGAVVMGVRGSRRARLPVPPAQVPAGQAGAGLRP